MTTKDLRALVWETHRHMPRLLKAKLATKLQGSYELVQEASTLLGLMEPSMYDVAASTIEGEELVLASADGPFARVYIGDNPKHYNRVIFSDGTTITGHGLSQLKGETLVGGGYYQSCHCNICFAARMLKASTKDRPHLIRNSTHVLNVPVPGQPNCTHSERVAKALRSANIRTDDPDMTPIISYHETSHLYDFGENRTC